MRDASELDLRVPLSGACKFAFGEAGERSWFRDVRFVSSLLLQMLARTSKQLSCHSKAPDHVQFNVYDGIFA